MQRPGTMPGFLLERKVGGRFRLRNAQPRGIVQVGMADTNVKIRRWGADWQQLQAEQAFVEASFPDELDHDVALEKLLELQKIRNDFHKRTHQPEPPKWE